MKTCVVCHKVKDLTKFPSTGRKCRACVSNNQRRVWKEKANKEGHRTIRSWRMARNPNLLASELLRSAKSRSKKKNWGFTLTVKDIQAVLESQKFRCPLTGWPIVHTNPDGNKVSPRAPSLDRIDSNRPYEMGNVRVVVMAANMAKGHGDDKSLVELADAVVKTARRANACLNYDEEIKFFTEFMRLKLRANAHRGKWQEITVQSALAHLKEEILELEDAISSGDRASIVNECSDVGNMALIVFATAMKGK